MANILTKDVKICGIEESHQLFRSLSDPSFCAVLSGYNNQDNEIHPFFLETFFLEKTIA